MDADVAVPAVPDADVAVPAVPDAAVASASDPGVFIPLFAAAASVAANIAKSVAAGAFAIISASLSTAW